MKALGAAPDDVLKDAGVASEWKLIKFRWKKNQAPEDRGKIRDELVKREKRKATEIGSRLLPRVSGLEEWTEIGAKLARNPDVFNAELRRLRPIADKVMRVHEIEMEAAVAKAELEAELSTSHGVPQEAFESPTPKPKGTRK